MKFPDRNQVAAVVLIAGGFVCALAFIPMGLEILQAGVLTYEKTGGMPRTVSPQSGAFEFYYQVAFLLTLGTYPFLLSIGGMLTIVAIGLIKLGINKTSLATKLTTLMAKIVLYLGMAVGFVWIALLVLRFRVL